MSRRKPRAPCGHIGEHVIGNYIRCLQGCEGEPDKPVEPEVTKEICLHNAVYKWAGDWYCAECEDKVY